jgi:hypothetical protein
MFMLSPNKMRVTESRASARPAARIGDIMRVKACRMYMYYGFHKGGSADRTEMDIRKA